MLEVNEIGLDGQEVSLNNIRIGHPNQVYFQRKRSIDRCGKNN